MLARSHTFGRVTSGQYFTLAPVTATAVTVISQQCRGIGYKISATSQPETVYHLGALWLNCQITERYQIILNCKGFFLPLLK